MAKHYFNWTLAFVLLVAVAVFAMAAYALHGWQRSTRAEQALPLGEQAYEQGDWEKAASQLGRYVAVHSDDIEVLLKYADAQLKRRPITPGNLGHARAAYSSVLRQDVGNVEAARKLVELYLGSPGEAELKARRFLEGADDAGVRRLLGIALIRQRKFQEAEQCMVELVRDHPKEISAYELMGEMTLMSPDEMNEPAAHWLDEAVSRNPESALAYATRSGFRRKTGDRAGALEDINRAVTLDLSETDAHLRVIGELINLQEMDRARSHLETLRSSAPSEQGLWLGWAAVAMRSESAEEMQTVAEAGLEALATQPWDFMLVAAELFIQADCLEQAQESIVKMKERNIQPPRVTFLEGLLAEKQGRIREAIDLWETAIGLGYQGPEDKRWGRRLPLVRMVLASAFVKLGDPQSALGHARSLVSQMPQEPLGHLLLARLESRTGNWAAVLEHAGQVQRLTPENDEVVLLELQARVRQLAGIGARAGDDHGDAWQSIDARLAELADNAEATIVLQARLLQAESAVVQGRHEQALAVLDAIDRDYPADARTVLLRTRCYVGLDNESQAIATLQKAIEQFPQSAEVVTQLALVFNGQEKHAECETVLKEAMSRIELPRSRRNLGLLLAQLYDVWGREGELLRWLTEVDKACPDDIQVKRRLLAQPRIAGDAERAQGLVDQIKSLEGDKGWQWRIEQTRLWIGQDDFESHYTEAVQLLQDNLLANPDDQTSRVLLGAAYEKAGEKQLAATIYKEALDRAGTPDDRQIRLILAGAYEKAGNLRLALDTYREALKEEPDNMLVVGRTVQALHRAGEFEEAGRILDTAAARDLDSEDLQRLRLEGDLQQGELGSASDILQDMLDRDPNDLSSQFRLALVRIQQERFDEAHGILTSLREIHPDSVLVTQAQVRLHITQGENEKGLQLCDDLVGNNSKNVPARILRARIRAELGLYDLALADLNEIVQLVPELSSAWMARADFYRDLGRSDEEMADVRQALRLAPEDRDIQVRALRLAAATNDRELLKEAEASLEKVVAERPKDAELKMLMAEVLLRKGIAPAAQRGRVLLEEVTRLEPSRVDAWELLGGFELSEGRLGDAVDVALRGLTYNPDDRRLLLLKADAEAQRAPMLAVPTLKELLRQDPNDLDAMARLARVTVSSQVPEKIEAQLAMLRERLGVLTGPAGRRCKLILAITLNRSGQAEQAMTHFRELLRADPNDPAPLRAMASVPGSAARNSEYRQLLAQWMEKHPTDAMTPVSVAGALLQGSEEEKGFAEELLHATVERHPEAVLAYHLLADLAFARGRAEEFGLWNRKILDVAPKDLVALNNLAWHLCEDKGEYAEALALANQGLQVESQYADLIDTRGVIYYRTGRFEEAIQDFKRFISLCPSGRPSLPTTRFHLARAYAEMGRKTEAVRQLELILATGRKAAELLTENDRAEATLLLEQLTKGS